MVMVLVIVLVFIVGVRYGQSVEKTNEKISYFLSITPTQKPTSIPLEYKTYKHPSCGIQFTYPSVLRIKETSQSSTFMSSETNEIEFSCDKSKSVLESLAKEPTVDLKFQGKMIKAQETNGHVAFTLRNPRTGDAVTFLISKGLLSLLEPTLEFPTK